MNDHSARLLDFLFLSFLFTQRTSQCFLIATLCISFLWFHLVADWKHLCSTVDDAEMHSGWDNYRNTWAWKQLKYWGTTGLKKNIFLMSVFISDHSTNHKLAEHSLRPHTGNMQNSAKLHNLTDTQVTHETYQLPVKRHLPLTSLFMSLSLSLLSTSFFITSTFLWAGSSQEGWSELKSYRWIYSMTD